MQLNVEDLKKLVAAVLTPGATAVHLPKKDADTFKVSIKEKAGFKRLSGLQERDDNKGFQWFWDLFDKHQDYISKNQIILDALDAAWIMDDVDVLMYPTLL